MTQNAYILLEQAERIATQIGAKVVVTDGRARFMIGNMELGSTMIDREGDMTRLSRHAVHQITGILPA